MSLLNHKVKKKKKDAKEVSKDNSEEQTIDELSQRKQDCVKSNWLS